MDRLWKETGRFLRERLAGESGKLLLFVSASVMVLTATGCGGSPETNDAEMSWTDEAEYSSGEEDFEDVEVIKAVYRDVRDRADGLAEDVSGTPSGDAAEASVREKAEAVSILTAEEERYLQEEAKEAAALCAEYYRESGVFSSQTGASGLREFSGKQRKDIVERLGKQGLVSVSDGINMENHEKIEEFYAAYTAGADAMVTVYEIYREGDLSAKTLIHRGGDIQSYYVSTGFSKEGKPEIKGAGVKDLEEMRMTEKGYLIYTNGATVMHGNLREYYRVKPLSDRCRELTDQYIYGLSYVNYNMLVTDWDAGNVEDILMPCMFEDIYRICTGEPFRAENGRIPAKTYERIMTTCFPVSADQLREHCDYRADTDSYPYEMIFGKQFPPFGEVVDYTENKDGTITLYVDGVWIDYDSDEAFSNTIVVQPFADGTFRYLSNTIEERELEIPKVGKEQ